MVRKFSTSECDLTGFLDLVSNTTIRKAAWPLDDWIAAGGDECEYAQISHSDTPPIIRHRTLFGLLREDDDAGLQQKMQDPVLRAQRIAEHWHKVEAHPFYRWVKLNAAFDKACKLFDEKSRRASPSSKYASDLAKLRFLYYIGLRIGGYFAIKEHGGRKQLASARQRQQAIGHADKLLALFDCGIGLRDWQKNRRLTALLTELVAELDSAPRKDKSRITQDVSQTLATAASDLLCEFGEASPTLLCYLAEMMGWDPDTRTIDRIAKNARIAHARKLGDLLSNHPGK